MAYGFGTEIPELPATASLPLDVAPSAGTGLTVGQSLAAVGAVAGIVGAFADRGSYRTQARWQHIIAEMQVGEFYRLANQAGAKVASNVYGSGFGSVGISELVAAERGEAEADAAQARLNARITATALRSQGDVALVSGIASTVASAGLAFAGVGG